MTEPNYMAYAQYMGSRNPMAEGLNSLGGTLSDIQKQRMEMEDRTRRNSLADLQLRQGELSLSEAQRQATDRAGLRNSLANLQSNSVTTIAPEKTAPPSLGLQAVPGGQYLNGSPTPQTGSLESEMAANGLTNNAEGFQYPQQPASPIVQAYNEGRVATKTTPADPMKVLFDYAMKTGDYDAVKNALPLETVIRKRAAEASAYGDLATADKLELEASKIEKMGGLIATLVKTDKTGTLAKQYIAAHKDLFPGIDGDKIGIANGVTELKGNGYTLVVGPDGVSHVVKDASDIANQHQVQEIPSADGRTAQKMQYNPKTQRYDIPLGGVYKVKSQVPNINIQTNATGGNSEIESWGKAIKEGRASLSDVPARGTMRNQVVKYLEKDGGVDYAGNKAENSAYSSSLTQQQKQLGSMGSFVKNLNAQIDRVGQIGAELYTADARLMNVPIRKFRQMISGSPQQSKYDMYITEIENEIGKLSTGSTASVAELSVGAQEKWAKIHDKNLSVKDMLEILKETKHAGDLRIKSVKEQIDDTRNDRKDRIGNKDGNPAPGVKRPPLSAIFGK